MNRRSALGALLCLAYAPGRDGVLLVGDSLAFQLGYRLGPLLRSDGRAFTADGRGGTSAHQWLRLGWFKKAFRQKHRVVLVSLGTNCTRVQRPALGRTFSRLKEIAEARGKRMILLFPPPLSMSTDYIETAVRESGVETFRIGKLPMDRSGIHPTHEGHVKWAKEIATWLV